MGKLGLIASVERLRAHMHLYLKIIQLKAAI